MLGKLLKYDLKWIYKAVVVFYILALIFSVIGRGLSLIENSVLFGILTKVSYGIAISMLVSAMINNLMRVWARVIRNVYKDESYLTHTLPVEKKQIYLSKFISAIITMFTTVVVSVVCIGICYYSQENIEILKNMLELAATTYNSSVISLLFSIFCVFFLEMLFILLIGIVGIILGYRSSNNKIIKSIVYAFAMYMITNMVALLLVFLVGTFNSEVMNLFNTVDRVDIETIKNLMYAENVLYLVYILIFYVVGKRIFEKGVNVD